MTQDLRLQTSTRQILSMAIPISMALLVPQINFITNNIFLSGLGEQELACAGITGVYYLIFAVIDCAEGRPKSAKRNRPTFLSWRVGCIGDIPFGNHNYLYFRTNDFADHHPSWSCG